MLGTLFSRIDATKRQVKDALSNPSDYLDMVLGRLQEGAQKTEQLQTEAFGDPTNPVKITNKDAFNKLADQTFESVTNMATLGMISGIKGLKQFITTKASDQQIEVIENSLKKAKELKKEGASFEEQVKKTGFGYGPDGKLRFEVPDTGANFKIPVENLQPGQELKANELLSHPLLYDFYPELANVNVRIVKEPKKTWSGAYNFDTQTIDLNIGSKHFKNPITAISNALHETQHFVQSVEDFAKGSNWKSYLKDPKNYTEADKAEAIKRYMKDYGEAEARNVQFRFEDPLFAKVGEKTGVPYNDKTAGTTFTESMGKDPYTVDVFGSSLDSPDFVNVNYVRP
jgi:hypothetical protein